MIRRLGMKNENPAAFLFVLRSPCTIFARTNALIVQWIEHRSPKAVI